MLDWLRAAALALSWTRPLLLAGLAAGIFLFLAGPAGIFPGSQDRFMIPGLLLTSNCLLLLVGLTTFPGVPEKPNTRFSFVSIKIRLLRLMAGLLAILFLLTGAASLFFLLKMTSVWIRSL